MRSTLAALFLLLILTQQGLSQCLPVGKVVMGEFPLGSCVVVSVGENHNENGSVGFAVTALHVVQGHSGLKIEYECGRVAGNCQIAKSDARNDLALIRTWIPPQVSPVSIHRTEIARGVVGRVVGFSLGKRQIDRRAQMLRRFKSIRLGESILNIDHEVMPGQSGGAFFIGDKLAGIVLRGVTNPSDTDFEKSGSTGVTLWPTQAAGRDVILELMEDVEPRATSESK